MFRGRPRSEALRLALPTIYFEEQKEALCGLHCLNNAVQSAQFNVSVLSEISDKLDEKELQILAEKGTDTKEYKEFIANPSSNFDKDGNYNLPVLIEALQSIQLELVFFTSGDPRAVKARGNPLDERLYICHLNAHWFCMRRFGSQWVNLNSTRRNGPELLNSHDMGERLIDVKENGRLFVVFGELPTCQADEAFEKMERKKSCTIF